MVTKSYLILVILACILAGCIGQTTVSNTTRVPSYTPTLSFSLPTPTEGPTPSVAPTAQPPSSQQTILDIAFSIIGALKNNDMARVSQYIHPDMGLRFSPYATVKDSDQVFPADKVGGLFSDSTVYTWGNYDGSGQPIDLAFPDYYAKFIYDVDFASAPQISLNHRLATGNSIDNAQEFYPGAMIVEFYFPGFDPQYNGMDWRSLRLVFLQSGQDWYLAGIIHDQWTI